MSTQQATLRIHTTINEISRARDYKVETSEGRLFVLRYVNLQEDTTQAILQKMRERGHIDFNKNEIEGEEATFFILVKPRGKIIDTPESVKEQRKDLPEGDEELK